MDTLILEGELGIYEAADLKPRPLDALTAGRGPLALDLGAVTALDSAGVQLLMLAKHLAAARGRDLRLVDHSPPVLEVFELLGLAAFFGDPLLMDEAASGDRADDGRPAR